MFVVKIMDGGWRGRDNVFCVCVELGDWASEK